MTDSQLETIIREIVKSEIEQHDIKLKKEDAQEIINAILPEIDVIVSKIIISHFKTLAYYIQNNLKD